MSFLLMAALAMTSPAPACAFNPANGVIAHASVATPAFEAADRKWFIDSETVSFAGGTYGKYGLPRQLSPMEIEAAGDKDDLPIFIEAGHYVDEPEVIYIMVKSADCSFQPYERQ